MKASLFSFPAVYGLAGLSPHADMSVGAHQPQVAPVNKSLICQAWASGLLPLQAFAAPQGGGPAAVGNVACASMGPLWQPNEPSMPTLTIQQLEYLLNNAIFHVEYDSSVPGAEPRRCSAYLHARPHTQLLSKLRKHGIVPRLAQPYEAELLRKPCQGLRAPDATLELIYLCMELGMSKAEAADTMNVSVDIIADRLRVAGLTYYNRRYSKEANLRHADRVARGREQARKMNNGEPSRQEKTTANKRTAASPSTKASATSKRQRSQPSTTSDAAELPAVPRKLPSAAASEQLSSANQQLQYQPVQAGSTSAGQLYDFGETPLLAPSLDCSSLQCDFGEDCPSLNSASSTITAGEAPLLPGQQAGLEELMGDPLMDDYMQELHSMSGSDDSGPSVQKSQKLNDLDDPDAILLSLPPNW